MRYAGGRRRLVEVGEGWRRRRWEKNVGRLRRFKGPKNPKSRSKDRIRGSLGQNLIELDS